MSSATIPPVVQNNLKARQMHYETMLHSVPPAILRKRVAKMLAYMAECHNQLPEHHQSIKDDLAGTANYLLYGIRSSQ
jgi:hypothetical protein